MIGLYLFWSTSVGSYQAFELNSWCFDFSGLLCCNCVRCTVEFVGFNPRAVFFFFVCVCVGFCCEGLLALFSYLVFFLLGTDNVHGKHRNMPFFGTK